MKVGLINGSPKNNDSASGSILEDLRSLLETEDDSIHLYHLKKPIIKEEDIDSLKECDVLVLAFPLYVDGIPSHLLNCLTQLEHVLANRTHEITVYTIVNCGFYEGHQNRLAVAMMDIWTAKAGLKWGQGIGIGAGGMIGTIRNVPLNRGPKKNLFKALTRLVKNVHQRTSDDNLYITLNFPKIAYKFVAEINWWLFAKANGLRQRDLSIRK